MVYDEDIMPLKLLITYDHHPINIKGGVETALKIALQLKPEDIEPLYWHVEDYHNDLTNQLWDTLTID